MPIVSMLSRSVENDLVSQTLPATVSAIQSWDALSGELPDELVYKAFAQDIQNAAKAKVGKNFVIFSIKNFIPMF